MTDIRVERLAKLLVQYSVKVQAEDKVLITGSVAGIPLIKEVYHQVILAGAHPIVFIREAEFNEILLKEGNEDQLRYIHEPIKYIIENYDCMIGIQASSNTKAMSGVDPARQQIVQTANLPIGKTVMERSAAGEFRWTGTIFPTQAHAQDAEMSLSEYEDFVYGACHADKEDPIAEWKKMHDMQQILVDWLVGKKAVRVKGPHADLSLSIEERVFINSDGTNNMPSGEIFTGPVEDSINGWIRFSYPCVYNSREVEGVELHFENGKIVKATADKNEEYLLSVLDTDEGARFVGEFAIGTNHGITQFTRSILYDEKIGGTIHMAMGRSYPETGGKNVSAIHWDMICDMRDGGKIWIDDELFYDSGNFLMLNGNKNA